jgi:hypothetical protein
MTICVAVKVYDGIVLASDSASVIIIKDPQTGQNINYISYENANKIYNLIKERPIGVMTSGIGSIGNISIENLTKNFRAEISKEGNEWKIDKDNYTIEQITKQFQKYIYEKHYTPTFASWKEKPGLSFIVAGYSKNDHDSTHSPEIWQISIEDGTGDCSKSPVHLCKTNDTGIYPIGLLEPIWRLFWGFSLNLEGQVLKKSGLTNTKTHEIMKSCYHNLMAPLVHPTMPIQDAIDLAKFLVDMTEKFYRYTPYTTSYVSGPIEIAAITKHEGFNWVQRKLYFSEDLNPHQLNRGGDES